MIIPQYWAEARRHRPRAAGQGQVTIRRFGWSETSQAEAERMAAQRADEALARVVAGARLPRREPKVPYNGAAGVPIREEVLERIGKTVITRNSYGAHCLNTPDVLFADIDFDEGPGPGLVLAYVVVLLGGAALVALWYRSPWVFIPGVIAVLLFAHPLGVSVWTIRQRLRGGAEQAAFKRVRRFVARQPEWQLRLYRTPAGLRVLAMHRTFSATEPAVAAFFDALGVDRVYRQMCVNQDCFRARVGPKPWRVGVSGHIRPRPGVWPVAPERMAERQAWIRHYESVAAGFASCRFLEALGSGAAHPAAEAVRKIHDDRAQALSGRDIA